MSILLRGGFLLIYNTNCMEEPVFRGNLQEREKKINFIVLQDWEDTVNKFRTCTVEGGSLFVVTLRRHMQSISVTQKKIHLRSNKNLVKTTKNFVKTTKLFKTTTDSQYGHLMPITDVTSVDRCKKGKQ